MPEVGPLQTRVARASQRPTRRVVRSVARARRLRSGMLAPWVLPGAAQFHRARWGWMLRRAPLVTGGEHAARTGLRDIEEIVACDLCGQERFQPLFHAWAGKRRRHRYHVVRCPDCGFLYRQPGIKPERLGELYSSGKYGRFLTGKYSHKRQRRYRLVMNAFAPLFSDGTGRRLLDFGCGAGQFLELAHERGFDCYGVDLSADSIERAREHPWGANTYHGTPLDVPEIAAGGFDVITLWSVLAHLATPVEDFRMLRSLLAPDGVLLVLTVNANSLFLKARGEHWNGFTPNHLKFFSPSTLSRLLATTGFAAVTMPPMPPDSVTTGRARLSARQLRRLHRNIEHGNSGNMLRAVAYNDSDTPGRYGITAYTRRLDPQPEPGGSMDLKSLQRRAKQLIGRRGGTESLKADAEELKDIAKGPGSAADKAKRAAEALKDPGAKGPDEPAAAGDAPAPSTPTAPQPDSPETPEPGRPPGA